MDVESGDGLREYILIDSEREQRIRYEAEGVTRPQLSIAIVLRGRGELQEIEVIISPS